MNKTYWLFNCRNIATLISQAMDGELTFLQRLGVRFHLMMCPLCSTNQQQLLQLRAMLRQHDFPATPLPPEAKLRIKEMIKECRSA